MRFWPSDEEPRRDRSGLFIENEIEDVTRPGDGFAMYRPTGRRRAFIGPVRMPVRVVCRVWAIRRWWRLRAAMAGER